MDSRKESQSDAVPNVRITRSSQENTTLDQDGVMYERIRRLKESRAGAKGVVTKKRNELTKMMNDYDNVEEVRGKLVELDIAMKNFRDAHRKYHSSTR